MDWWTELDRWAADYLPDLRMACDEPMSRHTSFRVGGPAKRMAFPDRGEQLVLLLDQAERLGARPLVIGNGTNLLAPDEGLDRLVIDTSAGLDRLEAGDASGTVTAEAGVSLARLADFACRQGLTGLEFAHGIPRHGGRRGLHECRRLRRGDGPGGVGGLGPLSGGGHPDPLRSGPGLRIPAELPDGAPRRGGAAGLLPPGAGGPDAIRASMRELMEKRRASQPLEWPSAGSTFKRPEGHFAGTLIDQCGLKGLTVGGAQVSEKHAGFVINRGGASAADIRELIRQIQERVLAETGVRLEPEVKIID